VAGNVPDWRRLARGGAYYVDRAADLERELGSLVASARVRINTGGDPQPFILQIEQAIRELGEIPAKVTAEMRMLDAWIASETRGFFRQMIASDYKAQFQEQYEIYNLVLEAMPESLQFFNTELANLGSA
jgi:putative heme iron utilization protein